jgi:hypothetical protein
MTAPAIVLHAYGVTRAPVGVQPPDRGLGGARVQLVTVGSLVAIVSPVDAAAFGPKAWQEHAEDPVWLGRVAAEHQEVLGSVIRSADVLPFRLPGMYTDEASLREVLATEAELLTRGLEATANHVEWGVQVFRTTAGAEDRPPRSASGSDYLRQVAARARRRQEESENRAQLAQRAFGMLADASSYSVTNPPQDRALSGREEPMLLNSAHLVVRRGEEAFFAVVQEVQQLLAGHGLSLEVTGPWPPYNFVHLGTEELRGTR